MPNQYTDNSVSRVRCVCETCDEVFYRVPSRIAKSGGRWCSRDCYDAARRDRPLESYAETFWPRVDMSGGPDACWEWQGARNRSKYGNVRIHDKTYLTHRIAWELANGPVPEGDDVLHHCDNPPCCNPRHLWTGDARANGLDMVAKGRHRAALYPGREPRGDQHYAHTHPELVLRGEKSGKAILTEVQVLAIREQYATGSVMLSELATDYGVTISAIWRIVHRKNWRHI
jgi:hypothetical protein